MKSCAREEFCGTHVPYMPHAARIEVSSASLLASSHMTRPGTCDLRYQTLLRSVADFDRYVQSIRDSALKIRSSENNSALG